MPMRNINVLWIIAAILIICSCKKTKNTIDNSAGFKVISLGHTVAAVKAIRLGNGNYVAVFHEIDNENYGLLIAMDSAGRQIWKREFSGDLKRITDIQPMTDGSFILVSYDDSGLNKIYLNCLNASGITKWNQTYTLDNIFSSVTSTIGSDGTINILAGIYGYNPGQDTLFMPYFIKYNSTGQFVSAAPIKTPDSVVFLYPVMAASPDGFYVNSIFIVPFSKGWNQTGYSSICMKMDLNGNIKWFPSQIDANIPLSSVGTTLCTGASGNTVLAGTNDSGNYSLTTYTVDAGNSFTFLLGNLNLISINGQTGNIITRNSFQLPGQVQRPMVIPTSDNGYLAAATCNIYNYNSFYPFHTALVKTDANLNQQWQRIFSTPYLTYPFSVLQTSNGGYIVFGITQSFNKNQELAFIKTDANGNLK
jgi:hypothetical protein